MVTPAVPPIPHVGGPITGPGHPLTLIGNMVSARVSDMATCVGPPDVIIAGAATVLINCLPAARIADNTAHGGMILAGWPTVLIGGPQFVCPYAITFNPDGTVTIAGCITIHPGADQQFQSQAIAAYVKMSTTSSGRQMIDGIVSSGRRVDVFDARTEPANLTNTCTPLSGDNSVPGVGSDSRIVWDANDNNALGPDYLDADGNTLRTDSSLILGHESVHAYHNALGTAQPDPANAGGYQILEESATVGRTSTVTQDAAGNPVNVPDYSGTPPSENSLRDELGFPRRLDYYPNSGGAAPF
jgi:uncharacterized Zn-binding protein involved in type VI secretion